MGAEKNVLSYYIGDPIREGGWVYLMPLFHDILSRVKRGNCADSTMIIGGFCRIDALLHCCL